MLVTYVNTTEMVRHIIDAGGTPREVAIAATLQYLDKDSRPSGIDGLDMKVESDVDGMPVYIGYAIPGTAEDEPGWAVKKRVVVGLVESWPWAGDGFVLKYRWDQRDSLDY